MRRLIAATVLSVLALGAATACGGGDVVTEPKSKSKSPDVTSGSKSKKPAADEPEDSSERSGRAEVGDTLTLKGLKGGSRLDVTVEKFVDPAKSSSQFLEPATGKKWVAALFKLDNKGGKVYEDSPINGAQVADKTGQRFQATIADVTAGPAMAAAVKLPPGETARGWLVFEVPEDSAITSAQWTPDSGFADDTGQWQIG
ncbi:DUF4352 domain-containing protein [Streptomyces sp. NBC_01381]|uniref:DUF4352 domain-containing protein n=1 Tax=Streptomyces sp. NBC_01381 TaxID=2903845 RepID=UPI0022588345|nr:DUF4352 domain-containing protein [Streptomyces sp. NBC_01381]MCX4669081.1 DUF4352 domain-containing protein [Streptomyces sp. NBC_01381]